MGVNWSGIDILSQPHHPWIFWYVQKVGFMGINNPLMIIVTVEEAANKNYSWDTLFISNDREAPREVPNKMQQ